MKSDEEFRVAGSQESSGLPSGDACVLECSATVPAKEDIATAVDENESVGSRPSEQPAHNPLEACPISAAVSRLIKTVGQFAASRGDDMLVVARINHEVDERRRSRDLIPVMPGVLAGKQSVV